MVSWIDKKKTSSCNGAKVSEIMKVIKVVEMIFKKGPGDICQSKSWEYQYIKRSVSFSMHLNVEI